MTHAMATTTVRSIRLSTELSDRIDAAAKAEGVSANSLMVRGLWWVTAEPASMLIEKRGGRK